MLNPLLDAGRLPHLARLVEGGCTASPAAPRPLVHAMLWTSLATGVRPERHGVCADVEIRPDRGGVQPVGLRSWRAAALWDILEAQGVRTAAINWPGTAPADRAAGIRVDERFAEAQGEVFATWPLLPHCVAPASLREILAELRVHPTDISGAQLQALVPEAATIDQAREHRLARLAVMLARVATVHGAATHIAALPDWDLLAVCYGFLGQVQRAFRADGGVFGEVVERAYEFQDMMLGRLLALAGPEATVFVVSPHGWMTEAAARGGAPLSGPRERGVLIAAGPGIVRDAMIHEVSVLDLCPTMLARFGLAADSLDGRVPDGLFATLPTPLRPIEPPPRTAMESEDSSDPAAPLAAMGYGDRPSAAQRGAMDAAAHNARVNLAQSHLERGDYATAARLLEEALRLRSTDRLARLRLAECRLYQNDLAAARPLAEAVLAEDDASPWGHLLIGALLSLEGAAEAAAVHLGRAREAGASVPNVMLRLGGVHLRLGRWHEAAALFREALALDPDLAEAHDGLGFVLHAQGDNDGAERALRRSIALAYHQPLAHLHLGAVLAARGRHVEAAAALHVALRQFPDLAEAKTLLQRVEDAIGAMLAAQGRAAIDAAQKPHGRAGQ